MRCGNGVDSDFAISIVQALMVNPLKALNFNKFLVATRFGLVPATMQMAGVALGAHVKIHLAKRSRRTMLSSCELKLLGLEGATALWGALKVNAGISSVDPSHNKVWYL